MRVGVISDTHGLLPGSVVPAFSGVERIVHAGDVGSTHVLAEIEAIAPVIAVRGNMDLGELAWRLPDTAVVRLCGYRLFVSHVAGPGPEAGIDIVISGHTHRSRIEREGQVLFVNPGSGGSPGRDGRGPTAALLDLAVRPPEARIIDL